MSELRSSSELRSLIDAAKADGPSATTRANVWNAVSSTVGAGVAGGAIGVGSLATTKLLVTGTLLGGTITVGIAGAALLLRPTPPPAQLVDEARVAASPPMPLSETLEPVLASRAVWLREGRPCTSEERPTAPTLPRVAQTASANHGNRAAAPPATRPDPRPESARTRLVAGAGTVATHRAPSVDDLDREASLLATARAALARGDAAGALHAVHATMVLRDRQLVPEELAIEAQALRALGRLDDAKALEERLRAKFPDSALAR